MSWHYQVLQNKEGEYQLHEVYSDKDGSLGSTQEPILSTTYPTKEELVEDLALMLKDAQKHDVLIPPADWNI